MFLCSFLSVSECFLGYLFARHGAEVLETSDIDVGIFYLNFSLEVLGNCHSSSVLVAFSSSWYLLQKDNQP